MTRPDVPFFPLAADALNLADAWSVLAESGECRFDPDLHAGPDRPESEHERAARLHVARELCGSCPVRALCLRFALQVRPKAGVWAAFTAEEIGELAHDLAAFAEVA
ncbi:WhiB family transcriptional regulator [Nonomuraea dietziae]|uniref:4Fe-4S Wbl-type domain-containing protein n=1 Tax=Nonomuraea dietziae TaxID=65515 RepID=A0A7W5Y7Z8_9ACTN|nr:WhiB family transcriptional regulator [Nonomuraea dietziae]MBB3728121.1 hypothetical protein [Nonomuraea dietziae]